MHEAIRVGFDLRLLRRLFKYRVRCGNPQDGFFGMDVPVKLLMSRTMSVMLSLLHRSGRVPELATE